MAERFQTRIEEADRARLSRQLVTLKDDVPVETELSEFAARETEGETLIAFLTKLGFKSMIKSAEARFGIAAPDDPWF